MRGLELTSYKLGQFALPLQGRFLGQFAVPL